MMVKKFDVKDFGSLFFLYRSTRWSVKARQSFLSSRGLTKEFFESNKGLIKGFRL